MPPLSPIRATLVLCLLAGGVLAQEVTAPKVDPMKRDDVVRGRAAFQANCAACHGANATGGMGPNLVASSLVRHDKEGDEIGKIVHEGRMDKGMPAFPNLSAGQIGDVAAFLHARIALFTRASALSGGGFGPAMSGDEAAGKIYFDAKCATCHTGANSLAGVAKKYDSLDLQARMLMPKPRPDTGTITLRSGGSMQGTFLHRDEFSTTLKSADGTLATWPAAQLHDVRVDDPLRGHRDLLKTYTDKDIHDVFAYLETLQ